MSLDKLIDLLSTSELFFAPVASFVKRDPFEGYLPAASIDALSRVSRGLIEDVGHGIELVSKNRSESGEPLTAEEFSQLQKKLNTLKQAPEAYFKAMMSCFPVNCWHANEEESEAMWRLYSENGKAIALETDVCSLKQSLQSRESHHTVQISPIRYVDFFDPKLGPQDCVRDGEVMTPLWKRRSNEHEREVRAFLRRAPLEDPKIVDVDSFLPIPVRVPVDLKALITRIHISPYAIEPFGSAVRHVCKALGLENVVSLSGLLRGAEELLKPFDV